MKDYRKATGPSPELRAIIEKHDARIDNQYVRASKVCPLCYGVKSIGIVACWPCYRSHDLKYGNEAAEATITAANTALECK